MKKAFNKLDYIISHFVSNDEMRPNLNRAYNQNNFIYASNGHILIRVPSALCAKKYDEFKIDDKKIPNFQHFMDEKKFNFVSNLSYSEILPCIDNIKIYLLEQSDDCNECDGHGRKECDHCGNEYDCKKCNGTGEIDKEAKVLIRDTYFEKDGDEIYTIEIAGKYYKPKYLELIMLCMLIMGNETCAYSMTGDEYNRGLFKFGDIEILLVGMMDPNTH